MALIHRFSEHGFEPQFQNHLLEKSKVTLEELHSKCENDYQRSLMSLGFHPADPNFEFSGIFVFLQNPTIEDKHFFLNHLEKSSNLDSIPYHVADIDENSFCYIDTGFVYYSSHRITISHAIKAGYTTVYIPQSQLSSISY